MYVYMDVYTLEKQQRHIFPIYSCYLIYLNVLNSLYVSSI